MPLKTRYIFTALWNVDTKIERTGRVSNQLRGLTPMQRYNLMAGVVRDAWIELVDMRDEITERILEEDADWLYLFVAPEYYFAASDAAHAIPNDDKRQIVGLLQALSARFTNLLLMPGTIAWKKPVVRPVGEAVRRGTATPKTRTRQEKFAERVRSAAQAQVELAPHSIRQQIAQQLVGADSERAARLRSPLYHRTMTEDLIRSANEGAAIATSRMALNIRTAPDRCFIARNTAYGFYGGQEVARYHKRGDYFEVFPSESDGGYVMYEPGGGPEGAGDRFTVKAVKFGVEVCLDHQLGYLAKTNSGYYPDVQVIMSADVPFIADHSFIIQGGYVVHASSNRDCTGIHHNNGGRIEAVVTRNVDTTVGQLRFARLAVRISTGPMIIDDYLPS